MEATLIHHPDTTPYEIIELNGDFDLNSMQQQWLDFLPRVMHRSYLHEMLWAKAVSSRLLPGLVSYYCVFDKEILIAIIPLEKRILGLWPFQIRWLQLPTHSNIYLCDVLLDKSYCGDEIIHTVLDYIYYAKSGFRWDYCKLRKFSARSALFTQIKQNDPLVRAIDECVYIPCKDESDLKAISKKKWKNTSRLARRASSEIGAVRMSWSSSAVSNDQFFNDFMDIESSGWKGPDGSGTSVASDPISRAFFHSLMVDSNNELYTRVFQLQFGEEKVASILAIRNNSTWYLLKQGYTDKYKAYGPGSILLQALIELMIKDSEITEISLTTAPAWASRWHFGEIPVYEALLFAPSIRGKISQFCFHVKRLLLPLKASLESRLQGAGT